MITDWHFYLAAIPAVILQGLGKGGFQGMGALSLPLLCLVVPPVQAVAIQLPILMSQDIFLKTLLRSYGGPGYGHMIEFFLPRLARHGVPLERGMAMLTDNPRRLFEAAR